jgi:hypothetical protein
MTRRLAPEFDCVFAPAIFQDGSEQFTFEFQKYHLAIQIWMPLIQQHFLCTHLRCRS